MSKSLQILTYCIWFLFVLWLGGFFEGLTRYEVLYSAIHLPGKPISTVDLFMKDHSVIPYLFLFPWLGLVGFPLFVSTRASYWDIGLFLLRFCVFLSVEIILMVYFSILCLLPLTGMLSGMGENEPRPDAWLDVLVVGPFWLCGALLLIAAIRRKLTYKKSD